MLEILNASENQKEKFRSTANKLLNKYDEYIEISEDESYKHICLMNLGVIPTMVSYLKGDELIGANKETLEELEREHYHIFPPIRYNSSTFGKKPVVGLPIVLLKPNFFQSLTKKIVEELKILGDSFLEMLKN